jgi:CheY-like chemotaxis protein
VAHARTARDDSLAKPAWSDYHRLFVPSTDRTLPPEHVVHFYDRDQALWRTVADFAATGLGAGDRVLLVVTAAHRAAIELLIQSPGGSPLPGARKGDLVWVDADQVLDAMLAAEAGPVEYFRRALEDLLADSSIPQRMFGEVVALLASRGLLDAAIEIEALGEALARTGVPVLCAYDLRQLPREEDQARVSQVHDRRLDAPPDGPTILLADDYDDARDLYRDLLQMQGFRVVTAADGVQAIERARETRPAAILLDILMPRLNGLDVVKTLKQDPQLAHVPIVALTAHAQADECELFLAAGFDAVLTKPLLPERLIDTLRDMLTRA